MQDQLFEEADVVTPSIQPEQTVKERRRRRPRRALNAGERYRLAEWIKESFSEGDPDWTQKQWTDKACALLDKDVSFKSVISTALQCFDITITPRDPGDDDNKVLADAILKIDAALTALSPDIWDAAGRSNIDRLQRIAGK